MNDNKTRVQHKNQPNNTIVDVDVVAAECYLF